MAFVYILSCADDSLYVGWTEDIDSRLATHNEGRGGSYTARRRPVTIVFVESHETHESARVRERQLKRWTSAKKEALIAGDVSTLERLAISHASPRFKPVAGDSGWAPPLLLEVNTIGDREFARLIKTAAVRRIQFHGLRHTVATLMPACRRTSCSGGSGTRKSR